MSYTKFTPDELARLAGMGADLIPAFVQEIFDTNAGYGKDLEYTVLDGDKREAVIMEILTVLDSVDLTYSGPHRHGDWEKGWGENLAEFVESGFDPMALLPKYYDKVRPCRYKNQYVLGRTGLFMWAVSDAYRRWIFSRYFGGCDSVHEFGCGTGHNLAVMNEVFPGKRLVGYDWAEASQRILGLMRENLSMDVTGEHFDFYDPDQKFDLGDNAGVLTFGALEQVADRHGPFLDRLLEARPAVCVHIEGFSEMYDSENNLMDYLALRYHRKRNYLDGYLPALRELAEKGEIEILTEQRVEFGNLFDDPYSLVVWKPAAGR